MKKVRAFLLPVQRIGNNVKLKFSLGQTWWMSIGVWKVVIYDYEMEDGIHRLNMEIDLQSLFGLHVT